MVDGSGASGLHLVQPALARPEAHRGHGGRLLGQALRWKAGRLGMALPRLRGAPRGRRPRGVRQQVIPVYGDPGSLLGPAPPGRREPCSTATATCPTSSPSSCAAHGLPDRAGALEAIHRPADRKEANQAGRLVDELFVLQVGLALRRRTQEAGQHDSPSRPTAT